MVYAEEWLGLSGGCDWKEMHRFEVTGFTVKAFNLLYASLSILLYIRHSPDKEVNKNTSATSKVGLWAFLNYNNIARKQENTKFFLLSFYHAVTHMKSTYHVGFCPHVKMILYVVISENLRKTFFTHLS